MEEIHAHIEKEINRLRWQIKHSWEESERNQFNAQISALEWAMSLLTDKPTTPPWDMNYPDNI